jgi:glycosyltransferase involved in cell wall biosynthesis
MAESPRPGILVFTSVFPNEAQPGLGLFVRERMFRVAHQLPLMVVAPVPWFPFQGLIRAWRPGFRPTPPREEEQEGIRVLHPRFFSVPGLLKGFDGFFMALACLPLLRRLREQFDFSVIDGHFAYPDGFAAVLLGKWLQKPVTVTLRGTEVSLSRFPSRRRRILEAVQRADRVFTVADSIGAHLRSLGTNKAMLRIGNGVDLRRFCPEDRGKARDHLGLAGGTRVLVTIGGLCERKGFHRVIDVLPRLRERFPDLCYLIVGGPSPEGDWGDRLRTQVAALGLDGQVRFLGPLPPDELRWPLSAADLFVLATRNEGWANVLLEAMACGLPVVATDVGGNREVVADARIGSLVPFGDPSALTNALIDGLEKDWDGTAIEAYAAENSWDHRVGVLVRELEAVARSGARAGGG